MPIIRVSVRAYKEGERWVCVRVLLRCWSEHTGAEVLGFYLKTLLYFWHTLHPSEPAAFLLTDSLSLTPDHGGSAPAIWPRLKNTLMVSQGSGGHLESRLQNRLSFFINNRLCRNWKLIHLWNSPSQSESIGCCEYKNPFVRIYRLNIIKVQW